MQFFTQDGIVDYEISKAWKCKNGLFDINPQDTHDCEFCKKCNVQKGIIIEDANRVRFDSEENINNILDDNMENRKETIKKEIKETRQIINNFAARDLYSANCIEVKYLYRRLHQLEAELEEVEYEEPEEEDYTPQFIGGSDVPIGGYYE